MMVPPQELNVIPVACCTLDISGAEQERLVRMFKALGNPSRFEVMKYLVKHCTQFPADNDCIRYTQQLADKVISFRIPCVVLNVI